MSALAPVRPSVALVTDDDVRECIRAVLLPLCSRHGPTRVAKALGGVDEKTIRRARDEQTTLCLDTAVNLLALDPLALDGFLARHGRRSVPIGATCDTDGDRCISNKVLKAALALSVALEDDDQITPAEVRANRVTIEAARDSLDGLLNKLLRAA